MHPTHAPRSHLDACLARGIWIDFYDPDGDRYGLPTYPWRCAPDGLLTIRQLRDKGLRPGGQDIAAQILWRRGKRRRLPLPHRPGHAQTARHPRPIGGDRPGAGRPPHLPHLPDREGLLHPALNRRMQRLRGRGVPMMAPPSDRRSGVNRSLTPKRRTRVTENDEYAAFLRRVIRAYSRRVASGDIDALAGMATLADRPRPGHHRGHHRPACPARATPGPTSASGSASPARPPSNAGAPPPVTVTTTDGTGPTGSRP